LVETKKKGPDRARPRTSTPLGGLYRGVTEATTGSIVRVAFEPDGIPSEFKTYAQWVIHRNKEPYDPCTGRRASVTDSRTWSTFPEALEAYESGRWDGLGFVFSTGDPYTGIDLDACRNPQSGQIDEWAAKIIDAFPNAYKEVSLSGCGVHLIVRGKAPNRKRAGLEVYAAERYFVITGVAL
jgi:putative DNA primase/helicase